MRAPKIFFQIFLIAPQFFRLLATVPPPMSVTTFCEMFSSCPHRTEQNKTGRRHSCRRRSGGAARQSRSAATGMSPPRLVHSLVGSGHAIGQSVVSARRRTDRQDKASCPRRETANHRQPPSCPIAHVCDNILRNVVRHDSSTMRRAIGSAGVM